MENEKNMELSCAMLKFRLVEVRIFIITCRNNVKSRREVVPCNIVQTRLRLIVRLMLHLYLLHYH